MIFFFFFCFFSSQSLRAILSVLQFLECPVSRHFAAVFSARNALNPANSWYLIKLVSSLLQLPEEALGPFSVSTVPFSLMAFVVCEECCKS